MANPAKELLETIYGVCDSLDDTPISIRKNHPELSLRKVFMVDVASFIMYLSASDGHVSWREADYLSELLGFKLTPDDMHKLIKEHNYYSVEYEETVPISLQYFVKADKWMKSIGKTSSANLATTLIDGFYQAVGKNFIGCDNDVDSNELRDLNIYLNTLRSYVSREMNESSYKSTSGGNSLKSRYEILKKN